MSFSSHKLVVFGDSYIEGGRRFPVVEKTPYNICYYLQKNLGVEVINLGKSASSNTNIAHTLMRYIQENDVSDCAFFICWSIFRRFFALDESNTITHLSPKRIHESSLDEYFPEYDNIEIHRMLTEQATHSVRMICRDFNIPFLMMNSVDQGLLDNNKNNIQCLRGGVRKDWVEGNKWNNTMFDIITNRWLRQDMPHGTFTQKFYSIRRDWERDRSKYPYLTECFHPTNEGNELIAQTISPYIERILSV